MMSPTLETTISCTCAQVCVVAGFKPGHLELVIVGSNLGNIVSTRLKKQIAEGIFTSVLTYCLPLYGGQGRSSRNSRYTEKLDRLPIWLSNTCHGTSTLQICKLMDRSTCLAISEAHRMFWNTLERTAFPELNLKLIVYMLFNNIFFQIHILLQISCHFLFMSHALAGIYTRSTII